MSTKDRVNDLISRLTLDEKAILLTARESPLNFIERLGIPEYDWGTNCEHALLARCGSSCPTGYYSSIYSNHFVSLTKHP